MKSCTAVIVAGGQGLRVGGEQPKQYLPLLGKPVLVRTLDIFEACPLVQKVILVIGAGQETLCQEKILPYGHRKIQKIVPGGSQRQLSVYAGLLACDPACSLVLVHDGARPFVGQRDLSRVIARAAETGAAVLGTRISDTVKRIDPTQSLSETLDRSMLWMVQTPQVFSYSLLKEAHEAGQSTGVLATDDSQLVERLGHPVQWVESAFNLKITTAEDLVIGNALLKGGWTAL